MTTTTPPPAPSPWYADALASILAALKALIPAKPNPVTTTPFGWESVTLMNQGLVMAVPVINKMVLKGVQFHVGTMFTAGATGASNVLATMCVMPAAQWPHWQIPGDKQDYIALPVSADFGTPGFAGAPRGGGMGGKGQLFAVVPKTDAPTAANIFGYIPLHDMTANPGDGIFFHMDHMGAGPCDAEMQGTLFYALA